MKSIKVVKQDGSTLLSKEGTDLDILELTTYLRHERLEYQGNTAYIYLKAY
ncbi:hypothetical protein [Paenibacillus pini]|uniref:Uncharacterized protein n=1 Tax=Paenibacillus pini JCM 16418 TaxID=1236976 RepID=W7YIV4_9BACL|nr:hypothetical protein [Paenibacillus pini]GAF10830.1 hypothetical protein JCM16418_5055 [Paenibacillus pini JCM 16418]